MIYTPTPPEFGAPAKFHSWRDGQDNLFWDVLDSKKRFSIHNAPVGCGKSLGYMTAALAMGKRVAVLTESKGLQDQIHKDFSGIGLYDMRGLANYTCRAMAEGGHLEAAWNKRWGRPTCEMGPCTAGLRCDLKNSGCDYFDSYKAAYGSQLVSTNYAYWIAIHKYGEGLGKFDMLVCDEAHAADAQLSSALSVEFDARDVRELKSKPPKADAPLQNWRMWARVQLQRVQGKLDFYTKGAAIGQTATAGTNGFSFVLDTDIPDASELKFWKKLEGKCKTLSESTDDWVIETSEDGHHTRIAPVWVRNYAETHLFLSIPRVVMMSATVRPKIEDLLGMNEKQCEFKEYPSTFPVSRRPIYWIPTVRLNYNTEPNDLKTWAVRIDQIIARRLHWKGIIHTRSYERQRYLKEHSRFRDIMFANTAGNTRDVVQSFRDAKAPAILVSPSVGTGFDFPHDAARYQIIGKVPFRDARGAILKAQAEEDPDYLNYLTAQDLIQTYGRSNRAPDDFSETFIVDDSIEWFLSRYAGYWYDREAGRFDMTRRKNGKIDLNYFPYYFLEAFQRINSVPDPLELELLAC